MNAYRTNTSQWSIPVLVTVEETCWISVEWAMVSRLLAVVGAKRTTVIGGSLGSCVDEECSKLCELM